MKKWIITILLAVTLLALAVATHFWGARVIKFAVDNDKTVDALKKLLELLLAIAGIVPPVIRVLFGSKEKDSKAATAVTNAYAARDINTAGRDLQTGGTHAEHDLAVGRDLINQQTIIHQTVAQTSTPTLSPLHQLPPPPADFTGRTTELRELRAAIEKGGIHISGLQGQGGVGKTALALKLAEELSPNYPDAQIYLDLKGVSEKPLTAAEAMSHVLRTFHPEAKLPEKEEDLRAQYLSVLHNKRALLLMDNAKDAAQVQPLIPPAGCALLLTSRQHFALPGLQVKNLETLPPQDAKALLLQIAPRIKDEADDIAKLCGYLPQALRLAAAAIAVRVNLEPQDYARQLADEKGRLELLAGDDESVKASITLSYNLLDTETQKLWRRLSVFPDTFDTLAAAAVLEIETTVAHDALTRLLQFSMLEWNNSTKRYRLHDLMRASARQKWNSTEPDAAALRHASYYGATLETIDDLYLEGGESIMRGLALFDIEWGNIQAGWAWVKENSAKHGEAAQLCSDYPTGGAYVLGLRLDPRELLAWFEAALSAARQLNDRRKEGYRLGNVGNAYALLGEDRKAVARFEEALEILREIGDKEGEGKTLGNLGIAYLHLGDAPRAIRYSEEDLVLAREVGDRRGEAAALGNLGNAYVTQGQPRKAIEYHERALDIDRDIGYRHGESQDLGNLGIAHRRLGELRRAVERYEQSAVIERAIGDRHGEATTLWNMSLVLDDLGDRKKAIEHAEAALKILEEIEDPTAAKVRKRLEIWKNG